MPADSQSKTEKASPRRLQKARLEGKFPTSRELVAATQFIVFIVIAFAWFPGWIIVQAVSALGLVLTTLATFDRCLGRIRG